MLRRPHLALLLLAATLAAPAGASAATVVVNPGDNVGEKVTSASPGDTVLFKAGAHTGRADVSDATVTLAGEPGAFLINPSDGEGATVTFTAAGGTVSDLTVLSTAGTAVQFSGGGAAKVLRSTLVSTAKSGTALSTIAPSGEGANRTLTADSSVLVAKTALLAQSSAPNPAVLPIPSPAITTRVTARHVTAIGDLVRTESAPNADAAITVLDSIVRGALSDDVTAAADRNSVAANASDAGKLFVNPARFNYHLRADAPVIGRGKLTEGESATDIDGDPRSADGVSDYGADEFVNRAPTAKMEAPSSAVRQGVPATFTADGSSDPEGNSGGGVATYNWDFGDGTTERTTAPRVTHAFPARQAYTVTLTVTDKQGATSAPVTTSVTPVDGTKPTVTVGQPGAKQRIALYKKAKKGKRAKRQRVLFFGTAADDTAMGSVALALRPIATKNGQCRWFDGKRRLAAGECTSPTLLTPTLVNGQWRYVIPGRARLPRGPYRLFAVAVDASGLAGDAQTVDFRFR